MLITFFILNLCLFSFFMGFKFKEFFLSDHERTQKLLLKIKQMPNYIVNQVEVTSLGKMSLHKALPNIVERAIKGSVYDRWILYKSSKKGQLDLNNLHYQECHPKIRNKAMSGSISISTSNWPLDKWLDDMVQKNWPPAIVEKGQLLLKENTPQSNKKAVELLEKIDRGLGGNFVISCPILAKIFNTGIKGVPANPKKHAYYTQFI